MRAVVLSCCILFFPVWLSFLGGVFSEQETKEEWIWGERESGEEIEEQTEGKL